MSHAYHYLICGLAMSSDVPMSGLRPKALSGPPDLLVVTRDPRPWASDGRASESVRYVSDEKGESGSALIVWRRPDGTHRLRYSEGAEFIVSNDASRIDVRWDAPLTHADAVVYLVGPVLGFVMRLRGIVPLHASAVVVGSRAVLFVGDAGAGKSTTAAAFAARGYPVLSDDVVRIVEREDDVLACPSHPRLTVWPESAEALFGSPDALPTLTPTYSKRYLEIEGRYRYQSTPAPIEVIYVLGERAATPHALFVRTLTLQAALMALVRNTYCNYLLDAPMRAREFDLLSRVVQRISVREVTFGEGIEYLSDACEMLTAREPMERAVQHQ